jgi:hypothetical protein
MENKKEKNEKKERKTQRQNNIKTKRKPFVKVALGVTIIF